MPTAHRALQVPTAFVFSQPWQMYVSFAPRPEWMVASVSGYIDSPAATAAFAAAFFASFLNMWGFGNAGVARPVGTRMGPLESAVSGISL